MKVFDTYSMVSNRCGPTPIYLLKKSQIYLHSLSRYPTIINFEVSYEDEDESDKYLEAAGRRYLCLKTYQFSRYEFHFYKLAFSPIKEKIVSFFHIAKTRQQCYQICPLSYTTKSDKNLSLLLARILFPFKEQCLSIVQTLTTVLQD